MGNRKWDFTPGHWVYLAAHAVLAIAGFASWFEGSDIGKGVGSSLIATGITGYVVFLYLLLSQHKIKTLELLTRFGFVGAFEGRATRIRSEYEDRIARAKHRIDVLGFGLQALRQDHMKNIPIWKARAVIRILLIDPEFPTPDLSYAKQRDVEEGNPATRTADDVHMFIQEAAPMVEPGKFEIRLYRCLPSVNVFRIDNDVLWGPYFVGQQSRNSPTFVVSGGVLFDELTNHFNEIWKNDNLSRPVPDSWWHKQSKGHQLPAPAPDIDRFGQSDTTHVRRSGSDDLRSHD